MIHLGISLIALLQVQAKPSPVPPISRLIVMQSILRDLTYNAPHLTIYLRSHKRDPIVQKFITDGILGINGDALAVTEWGQKKAAAEGWLMAEGMIEISTGRLSYIPGSYRIDEAGREATLTYKWRYEENAGFMQLLGIAPVSSWPASTLPKCLGRIGKHANPAVSRTIHMWLAWNNVWNFTPEGESPIRDC